MNQVKIGTVDEAVEMAKVKLLQINVPAGLSRSVGLPINEAIDLLQAVQDAFARDDAERKAKEHDQPEPLFPEDDAQAGENDIQVKIEPIGPDDPDGEQGAAENVG